MVHITTQAPIKTHSAFERELPTTCINQPSLVSLNLDLPAEQFMHTHIVARLGVYQEKEGVESNGPCELYMKARTFLRPYRCPSLLGRREY